MAKGRQRWVVSYTPSGVGRTQAFTRLVLLLAFSVLAVSAASSFAVFAVALGLAVLCGLGAWLAARQIRAADPLAEAMLALWHLDHETARERLDAARSTAPVVELFRAQLAWNEGDFEAQLAAAERARESGGGAEILRRANELRMLALACADDEGIVLRNAIDEVRNDHADLATLVSAALAECLHAARRGDRETLRALLDKHRLVLGRGVAYQSRRILVHLQRLGAAGPVYRSTEREGLPAPRDRWVARLLGADDEPHPVALEPGAGPDLSAAELRRAGAESVHLARGGTVVTDELAAWLKITLFVSLPVLAFVAFGLWAAAPLALLFGIGWFTAKRPNPVPKPLDRLFLSTDDAAAIAELERHAASRHHGTVIAAQTTLARLAFAQGRITDAQKALDTALGHSPLHDLHERPGLLARRAVALRITEGRAPAWAALEAAAARYPLSAAFPVVRLQLAVLDAAADGDLARLDQLRDQVARFCPTPDEIALVDYAAAKVDGGPCASLARDALDRPFLRTALERVAPDLLVELEADAAERLRVPAVGDEAEAEEQAISEQAAIEEAEASAEASTP